MNPIKVKLDYMLAVTSWLLDLGEAQQQLGHLDTAMSCYARAGEILWHQNRELVSPRIESNLHAIAARLFEAGDEFTRETRSSAGKEACLHVFTETISYGGHTAMAARWMHNDHSSRVHHVALLSQNCPVPPELVESVSRSGGEIHTADLRQRDLERAAWLRGLAQRVADYVVLHVSSSDLICGVAFGTPGGPPVMTVNHAAHIFWTGASIADSVLNCRGSVLEEYWTTHYRGIGRCASLPIPLESPTTGADAGSRAARKCSARQRLGVGNDVLVLITVGQSYKYTQMEGLDFLGVCHEILEELPDAVIIAVGPQEDSLWTQARVRSLGRIKTVGNQPRSMVAEFVAAADLYLEGFPFGSTTALLEAGLEGLPVVLAPGLCPPPYGTDGVALDELLVRPPSIDAYRREVIRLARCSSTRDAEGSLIRNSIERHHTGDGWRRYLASALSDLPSRHSPSGRLQPVSTPVPVHEFWTSFRARVDGRGETILEECFLWALSQGLSPRLTPALEQACKEAGTLRNGRTLPLPILIFFCNALQPQLPASWARLVLRGMVFVCRKALLGRLRLKFNALFGW
jgi:glycosyltransferase involved in cell wall biosynthesis